MGWATFEIVVIALPVSWFPLAADYTRHVRGARPAFFGAAAGYGIATVALYPSARQQNLGVDRPMAGRRRW